MDVPFLHNIEALTTLLGAMAPSDLLELYKTCTLMCRLLDPLRAPGKSIWAKVRATKGAPDPSIIGMSDMRLLTILYTRGCDGCPEHPRVRTAIWRFKGVKLCADCYRIHTIRCYEIPEHIVQQLKLPYLSSDSVSYKTYFTADVARGASYSDEDLVNIESFAQAMDAYYVRQRKINLDERAQRKKEIDSMLTYYMPDGKWSLHKAYIKACKVPRPLSDSARNLLLYRLGFRAEKQDEQRREKYSSKGSSKSDPVPSEKAPPPVPLTLMLTLSRSS